MRKTQILGILIPLLLALLVSACMPVAPAAPPEDQQPAASPTVQISEPTPQPTELERIFLPVRDLLASRLAVAAEEISLITVETVIFNDGCLEAGRPNELCLQALTPGYRLHLDTPSGNFVVHVNEEGSDIRIVSGQLPAPEWPVGLLPVRDHVVETLGIPAGQVVLKSSQAVTFPDGCLGAAKPDELCLQVLTPGYRVVVETPQGELIFHTNENVSVIRPGPMFAPEPISPDA